MEVELSQEQQKAIDLFESGNNVLMLSAAGCGKSFVINIIQECNKDKNIGLVATTGVAAYSISGSTLHSFFGIGTGDLESHLLLKKVKRDQEKSKRLRELDILIIDEISMLGGELFEKLDYICKNLRNNNKFFGGIQIVLSGDILQLLCIFNRNNALYQEQDTRLIIESELFLKEFQDKKVVLKYNFRQKGDTIYGELLSRIRIGEQTQDDINFLKTRMNLDLPDNTIFLVSTNKKAQIINESKLKQLRTQEFTFDVKFSTTGKNKGICDILLDDLKSQFKQKGNGTVKLKNGCRVMLGINLMTELGLINGSMGTILEINPKNCIVNFDNGLTQNIELHEFVMEYHGCSAKATQIPLIVAYGITIHKSQSITLEKAILDIGDCFADHQCYVALSRVKTLSGLYLKSFNESKIKINQKMLDYTNLN